MIFFVKSTVRPFVKNAAFTLVELIVVITILAILATVGFLAMQGYVKDAKDATFKTNVRTVAQAVEVGSAADARNPRVFAGHSGALAMSGKVLGATLTGSSFGIPGSNYTAGEIDYAALKLDATKFSSDGARYYLSSVDIPEKLVTGKTRNRSFFQIAGIYGDATYLEGTFSAALAASSASGSETTVTGLIRNPDAGTGINTALISNVDAPATGSVTAAGSRYPGCDTDDVVLANGQKWAACNAGAINAFSGQSLALADSSVSGGPSAAQKNYMGNYYQWGRNLDVTTGVATAFTATTTPANFIYNTVWPHKWINPGNPNAWGGSGTTADFSTATAPNKALMTGPCATGYHVPTLVEWCGALDAIVPGTPCSGYQNVSVAVRTALMLPLAGYRYGGDGGSGNYGGQGSEAAYWLSTGTNAFEGYMIYMDAVGAYPNGYNWISSGYNVRCVKD